MNALRSEIFVKSFKILYKTKIATKRSLESIAHLRSGLDTVSTLETFGSFDNSSKQLLAMIADKASITTFIVHNPVCLNLTTFPFVQKLCIVAGKNLETENREIIRLMIRNRQVQNLALDNKFGGDKYFEKILKTISATTSITYF